MSVVSSHDREIDEPKSNGANQLLQTLQYENAKAALASRQPETWQLLRGATREGRPQSQARRSAQKPPLKINTHLGDLTEGKTKSGWGGEAEEDETYKGRSKKPAGDGGGAKKSMKSDDRQ